MQKKLHICIILPTVQIMIQRMNALIDNKHHVLDLPGPEDEVVKGVKWGRFDHLFTPAFWFSQVWYQQSADQTFTYRLGRTLIEEVVACLLGGHGLPAEVGVAAFNRIREGGFLVQTGCTAPEICKALSEPLVINGRTIRYRYPQQRSLFVSEAINRLNTEQAPLDSDLALRAWLLSLNGVGPKTASWITRNVLDSDNVAILDIHIYRAGLLAGVFRPDKTVVRHYTLLEDKLVQFARGLNVKLSVLDALMWSHMREFGRVALDALRNRGFAYSPLKRSE